MTRALLTASLTPAALAELERDFGWTVTSLPRGSLLADADGVDPAAVEALVIEAEPLDGRTLAGFPNLSLIACLRGNPVNVDVASATTRGIPVVYTPGRNAESVADLVLGLMVSCVRHIAHTHHLIVSRRLTEDRAVAERARDVIWRPSDPSGQIGRASCRERV